MQVFRESVKSNMAIVHQNVGKNSGVLTEVLHVPRYFWYETLLLSGDSVGMKSQRLHTHCGGSALVLCCSKGLGPNWFIFRIRTFHSPERTMSYIIM